MNKTLFIGGPKDGKREIYPQQGGVVQVVAPNPGNVSAPISPAFFGITTHTYKLHQFKTPKGVATVAAHSSVPDVMEQLLKGYRYHRNPRSRTRYSNNQPIHKGLPI